MTTVNVPPQVETDFEKLQTLLSDLPPDRLEAFSTWLDDHELYGHAFSENISKMVCSVESNRQFFEISTREGYRCREGAKSILEGQILGDEDDTKANKPKPGVNQHLNAMELEAEE